MPSNHGCYECHDIGLQFLPNGMVTDCRRIQIGAPHKKADGAKAIVRRRVLDLRDRGIAVNSHLFDLAVTLSHVASETPADRDGLIDAHFKFAADHSRLRLFHKAIEELRSIWLLPVGSRKDSPAGYWIMTEVGDFSAWVKRAKSAPITQLTTIHRVARANFPLFAEQLELDFYNEIQVQEVTASA